MAVPQGYSGSSAIAMVQIRTNEFTALTGQQILSLLNAGVEQVTAELGAVRLVAAYPTTTGQLFQVLNNDIADIFSVSFSTGPIGQSSPPIIVYPMWQLDQAQFMDTAAGFPGVGAGPPQWYFLETDASNVITLQMYPPAMIGQLNVYYRGRPQLWADTTINSSTNLDTQAQEAVILWTCCRVLEAVQRGDESKDIFGPQYDDRIMKLKDSIARRSVPKSGTVRDVRALSYPSSPWWF
jgi:hypothetical protein